MSLSEIAPYPMPAESDLPGARVNWRPDPSRAVLLVHDMQRYFLRPFDTQRAPADELIHNSVLLRTFVARLGIPVAYTAQVGGMSKKQRGLLMDIWGPGMSTDPDDSHIIDILAPAHGDQVFTKWRYSALHNSGFAEWMRVLGRDQLIICGVYAHVGCLITAVDAFSHDIQPFFVADAVADFSLAHHQTALSYAAQNCASVLTTKALLLSLDEAPTAYRPDAMADTAAIKA